MQRILALALLLCAATVASCEYVELEDFHTAYEIVKPGDGAAVKKGDTVKDACGSKTNSTRCFQTLACLAVAKSPWIPIDLSTPLPSAGDCSRDGCRHADWWVARPFISTRLKKNWR